MLEIQRTNHTGQVTWCWERLRAGGEGDDGGWDGWMASPTQWTGAWESSGIWRRKGKHAVLHGVTKVGHNSVMEQLNNNHKVTWKHSLLRWPPEPRSRTDVPSISRKVWGVPIQVRASPASRIISPLSATLTSSALPSTLSHWSKCRRSPLLVRLSYKATMWTSLVVQWLRICLPMKTTWVWPLVREDPRCHGATKPVQHNY